MNNCSNHGINIIEFVQCCIGIKQVQAIIDDLTSKYGSLEVLEHYGTSYKIKLSTLNLSVGKIFEVFEEEYKLKYNISDYSVTQATLEQIFNSFAKEQYNQQPARIYNPLEIES